jgi:hypothetical protein
MISGSGSAIGSRVRIGRSSIRQNPGRRLGPIRKSRDVSSRFRGSPGLSRGLGSARNDEEASNARNAIQTSHGSYLMRSLEHATVAHAMHPGILSCPTDATLNDVAEMMAANHVHCIAVMSIAQDDSGESLV